jgi:pimeloyl-ACP methyl ester carboxylesterase
MREDSTIRLADGRALAYAQYGVPDGHPVFYFHGFPGSRLDWSITGVDGDAYAGARVIAVDRPGCGLSDLKPGRTMRDWPSDVAELADALAIERYAVLGISGGGPFALACGAMTPDRVECVGVICGMGPADAPGMKDGVSWSIPGKLAPMRRIILALTAMGIEKDPDKFLASSKDTMAPVDAQFLDAPQASDAFVAGLAEAFRNGTGGAAADAALYRRPWGFGLDEVSVSVRLWHGELDENVSVSVARYIADALPDCEATYLPNDGHLTAGVYASDALATLISLAQSRV